MMLRAALMAFLMVASTAFAADPGALVTYSKQARFEDVRDDLKLAIESKGLVIDYQSYLNRMLERTAKDVGAAQPIYVDAQAFVFCSASVSRKTMEADPLNAAMCPYSIVVFATTKEPGKINVSYRRPLRPDGSAASKAALQDVEKLLDSIARQAVGQK